MLHDIHVSANTGRAKVYVYAKHIHSDNSWDLVYITVLI